MTDILIANARIVDGSEDRPLDATDLRLADGRVQERGPSLHPGIGTTVIDAKGLHVLPGLIDAHVHAAAVEANPAANRQLPDPVVTVGTMRVLQDMLGRGFTTVRDLGGVTGALRMALADAPIPLPRLNICGKALSQTGGHADHRQPFDSAPASAWPVPLGALGIVCDGTSDLRKAAREQFRSGADFLKVMANGGVSSPSDPIHFLGFSREELRAAVEEAENAGSYVAAHLYTDHGIRRAVECGIASLEHCNLISAETARLAAEKGCIACPTLITYESLHLHGASLGMPPESMAKLDVIRRRGLESLAVMQEAGLPMAHGSDLLGGMHRHQSEEFSLRARVLPPQQVIAGATSVAARLLRMQDDVGSLKVGALADVLLVGKNPLADISALTTPGEIVTVIKGGEIVRDDR